MVFIYLFLFARKGFRPISLVYHNIIRSIIIIILNDYGYYKYMLKLLFFVVFIYLFVLYLYRQCFRPIYSVFSYFIFNIVLLLLFIKILFHHYNIIKILLLLEIMYYFE